MTFALTSSKFYGIETDEALTESFKQFVHLKITAANTDTAFDFGDLAGTLWGVLDNSANGLSTLNALKQLAVEQDSFASLVGKGIVQYQQVLSGAAGLQYVLTLDSTTGWPKLAYVSGSAPTVYDIYLTVDLQPGINPIKVTYS